jgi:hypothetical protein
MYSPASSALKFLIALSQELSTIAINDSQSEPFRSNHNKQIINFHKSEDKKERDIETAFLAKPKG